MLFKIVSKQLSNLSKMIKNEVFPSKWETEQDEGPTCYGKLMPVNRLCSAVLEKILDSELDAQPSFTGILG